MHMGLTYKGGGVGGVEEVEGSGFPDVGKLLTRSLKLILMTYCKQLKEKRYDL